MTRALHKFPGLVAALLVIVLTLSGAVLSIMPAIDHAGAPPAAADLSVADIGERVVSNFPGVEQIKRSPNGRITAFYFDDGRPGSVVIDPATGQGTAPHAPSAFVRWVQNLHRSLLLGDGGRIAAAVGAGAMILLTISGLMLTARRHGGWKKLFARPRGALFGRLHVELGRFAAPGLLLSGTTALIMAAGTFDLVPNGDMPAPFPEQVSGQTGVSPAAMALLRDSPLNELRTLIFPYPDDPSDVFTIKTSAGEGYIDQGTGELLSWAPASALQQVNETIYMLHTGEGAWWLGMILGLVAMCAPALAVTGLVIWMRNRVGRPNIAANASAGNADTVILVGSEGGSTWGFAATLHSELRAQGFRVHAAPMSRFAPQSYRRAERIIVLAATYGAGEAPASARGFPGRLASLPDDTPRIPMAILGFGDRQFPNFCAYAHRVADAARAQGWPTLMPMDHVDRQSPQDFARWGRALGVAMKIDPLELHHQPTLPRRHVFTLISRRDYGAEVQAPTAILRFSVPKRSGLWARLAGRTQPRFDAGDLLGVVPEDAGVPRFYSLASSYKDGFVEICVRRHPGGLCSGHLLSLEPGAQISAFIRPNPDFRPAPGRRPVILIGAGTGVGPLAGFARANHSGRAMHLYFGTRHPDCDLLYGDDLSRWRAEGRLSTVTTAFSRGATPMHVQDSLRRDAERVKRLIAEGAQVLVCGGRGMAEGVTAALSEILAPAGLSPATLKAEGRYSEDVY